MTAPTHTRTEYVVMWQWNGPEDNRGVVDSSYYVAGWCTRCGHDLFNHHGYLRTDIDCHCVCPGDWIIDRNGTYEVISDAEKWAQGWEGIE